VTRTQWEYAWVAVNSYAEAEGSPDAPTYKYQQKAWFHRGDDEPQELYHVPLPWPDSERFSWGRFLNDLGADGWEMVSHTIARSGINLKTVGWGTASEPLQTTYTFKRLVL
jgi:hypothetical protein